MIATILEAEVMDFHFNADQYIKFTLSLDYEEVNYLAIKPTTWAFDMLAALCNLKGERDVSKFVGHIIPVDKVETEYLGRRFTLITFAVKRAQRMVMFA